MDSLTPKHPYESPSIRVSRRGELLKVFPDDGGRDQRGQLLVEPMLGRLPLIRSPFASRSGAARAGSFHFRNDDAIPHEGRAGRDRARRSCARACFKVVHDAGDLADYTDMSRWRGASGCTSTCTTRCRASRCRRSRWSEFTGCALGRAHEPRARSAGMNPAYRLL
jgi:hypothetical protein